MSTSRVGTTAAAIALRNQCHYIIQAKVSTSPPEAYLFRGNAYMALNQPYFALSDYKIASSLVHLDSCYTRDAELALDKLPKEVTGHYPAVSSYAHFLVEPVLGPHTALKEISPTVGRGIFATGDLNTGDVALEAQPPWVSYPLKEHSCSFCAKPLPSRSFPCPNEDCHEDYCSRDCRKMAEVQYHSFVCKRPLYQAIEFDLHHKFISTKDPSERNAIAAYMLTTRIVATAAQAGMLPGAPAELKTLTGKLIFTPEIMATSVLDLYRRTAEALGFLSSCSLEEYVGVLARVSGNVFQTEEQIGLYVARSLFNHSCDENVSENRQTKQLVTKRPVVAGEELTINYYPHLKALPFAERHKQLASRGLVCECERCKRKL